MNAREEARFDMFKRVGTFGTKYAGDYTTIMPPALVLTPGQLQATTLFAALSTPTTGSIALITANTGAQAGAQSGGKSSTTAKSVLHDAVFADLKGINRTAAAIAVANNTPEIMDNFRMPHGTTDTVLCGKARAIADAAEALASDFIAHGHAATFVQDLRDRVTAFEQADSDQDDQQQDQVFSTATYNPLMKDSLLKVKQLDAFVHNFYATDSAKLTEWDTASHVVRAPKAATPPVPTPP